MVAVVASAVPRPRQGGGVRWALVLALVLVVLLQVAAAAHAVVRARGGIEALAADRAAVTAVVVVTGDPFVLAGRGDSARVLRDGTVEYIDVRGTRRAVGAPVLLSGGEALTEPAWRSTVRVRGRLGPTDRADDRVATLTVSGDARGGRAAREHRLGGRAVARRSPVVRRRGSGGCPGPAARSRHR